MKRSTPYSSESALPGKARLRVEWVRWPAIAVVLIAGLLLSACSGDMAPSAADAPESVELPTPTPTTLSATEPPVAESATAAESEEAASPPAADSQVIEDPEQLVLELQPIVVQMQGPLFATHAGDGSGRLFIVEKPGTIRILQDGELLEPPFLDISDRVRSAGNEQGLLGLAFPPNFSETGHLFVNYTDRNGNTQIARFSVSADAPNLADADSEFTVLAMEQPASNHNGGMLAFGPDGYLYIGTGDGGAAFDRFDNGQNPATLLGKMLRIDVTSDPSVPYTIPADNPWIESGLDGMDVRDEIWAIGMRNPWRYSFDRGTGDLWIGDVGQNQYEEINLTPSGSSGGLNYGWPIQEASHCLEAGCDTTGLVQPVLEYDHSGHCSVTGGYVYRGSQFSELQGVYLYGDYCSGAIWAAVPGADGSWRSAIIHRADASISSFGEDEGGELYLTDLSGGTLYRIALAE